MRILLCLLLLNTLSCNAQKDKLVDVFIVESSFGNIIYEGISNDIFYKSLLNVDKNKLTITAKDYCQITDYGNYFSIIPDTGSQTAIVNFTLNDSLTTFYVFNVQKLPLPKLMYTIPTEIDHLYLPISISKRNLQYLQSLDAFVQIGFRSWLNYEIDYYDIIIIHKDNTISTLRNKSGTMENKNYEILKQLESGVRFCFTNVICHGNGKEKLIFSEGIISIE